MPKFVANSHLLGSRSYTVCAAQIIIFYPFENTQSSPSTHFWKLAAVLRDARCGDGRCFQAHPRCDVCAHAGFGGVSCISAFSSTSCRAGTAVVSKVGSLCSLPAPRCFCAPGDCWCPGTSPQHCKPVGSPSLTCIPREGCPCRDSPCRPFSSIAGKAGGEWGKATHPETLKCRGQSWEEWSLEARFLCSSSCRLGMN